MVYSRLWHRGSAFLGRRVWSSKQLLMPMEGLLIEPKSCGDAADNQWTASPYVRAGGPAQIAEHKRRLCSRLSPPAKTRAPTSSGLFADPSMQSGVNLRRHMAPPLPWRERAAVRVQIVHHRRLLISCRVSGSRRDGRLPRRRAWECVRMGGSASGGSGGPTRIATREAHVASQRIASRRSSVRRAIPAAARLRTQSQTISQWTPFARPAASRVCMYTLE